MKLAGLLALLLIAAPHAAQLASAGGRVGGLLALLVIAAPRAAQLASAGARVGGFLALLLIAAPAAALDGIRLPRPALPAAPSGPGLWFPAGAEAALATRKADPALASFYERVRRFVDGRLAASLSTLGDDILSKVAKGAALCDLVGDVPGSGPYPRYRDLAAAAVEAMGTRRATTLGGVGDLDPQEDAGRLQSIAEAFDLLRGRLPAARTAAMAERVAAWADAFADDIVIPLRVNNISLKSGAALVTAALAMPEHPRAGTWLARGHDWVNAALGAMASPQGWYREGPHYLNYALNNLVSAAWHARFRGGADWFGPLRPVVRFAIDTRGPDGLAPPFEEGIPNAFPHHVLAPAYAGDPIAAEMAWAFATGSQDTVNYENQQLHDATAFLLVDPGIAPREPAGSPTRFFGGDTAVSVLRDRVGPEARQAVLFAALDHAATEILESRHNTRNPLDLVIAAQGTTLLPTSGGGPLVTRSANRSYYLSPSSKNLILVNGTAPFVTEPRHVILRDRTDSHGTEPGLCDLATAVVTSYAGAERVSRTVALVGGAYFVVADEVVAGADADVAVLWRGRGRRSLAAGTPLGASWTFRDAALEATALGSSALRLVATSGFYAERWGEEEAIEGIRLEARARELRVLTVFEPHPAATPASRVVEDLGGAGVAAARIEAAGTVDLVALGSGAPFSVAVLSASARLALTREEGGMLRGFAVAGATSLSLAGAELFAASAPVTAVVALDGPRVTIDFSIDAPAIPLDVTLRDLPGLDLARRYVARRDGAALVLRQDERGLTLAGFVGGGRVTLEPSDEAADAGAEADAGPTPDGASDAGPPDGGAPGDAAAAPNDAGAPRADAGVAPMAPTSGCSAVPGRGAALLGLLAFVAWAPRRRRRLGVPPEPAVHPPGEPQRSPHGLKIVGVFGHQRPPRAQGAKVTERRAQWIVNSDLNRDGETTLAERGRGRRYPEAPRDRIARWAHMRHDAGASDSLGGGRGSTAGMQGMADGLP